MIKRIEVLILVLGLQITLTHAQDLNAGIRLYESGKYDEAFTRFGTVKKETPQFAESRYYMGLIAIQRKDMSKAEEYTKQAISTDDNVAKYHVSMVNIYGQQAIGASMLKQASFAPKIKTHMEAAARLDPKDINSRIMLLQYYTRAPKMMGGDIGKARETADEIGRLQRAEGFRAHAMVDQAEEKYQDAATNYQKALNLAPDSLKHYTALASFYHGRSDSEQALAVYERAMTRFPANNNLLLQAGRVAATSGSKYHERGIGYINRYIAETPNKSDRNLANAYYYLGQIEQDKKNVSAARTHYNSALKVNPEHRQAQQALSDLK